MRTSALMPPSYVQRGDQASIIRSAIDFVKELEQTHQIPVALLFFRAATSTPSAKTSKARQASYVELSHSATLLCFKSGLRRSAIIVILIIQSLLKL
ncbi:unnamed protein product [Linum trigynum]|uniref:Uncharacterized protein n=1 Tax=Linum trigynum TaxID=586398 RepID=A0AAV2FDV3_9ROSI